MNINLLAVLVAAISAFVLGGIWYSSKAFGAIWKKEVGMPAETETETETEKKHGPMVYIVSFIFSIIAAAAFAVVLGENPTLFSGVKLGVIVGLFFVAASFGINYLFANRGYKLLFIDGGYHFFQFLLYGIILGLWH